MVRLTMANMPMESLVPAQEPGAIRPVGAEAAAARKALIRSRRQVAAGVAVFVVAAVLFSLTWLYVRRDHQPSVVEAIPSPSTIWDKTPRVVSIRGLPSTMTGT